MSLRLWSRLEEEAEEWGSGLVSLSASRLPRDEQFSVMTFLPCHQSESQGAR